MAEASSDKDPFQDKFSKIADEILLGSPVKHDGAPIYYNNISADALTKLATDKNYPFKTTIYRTFRSLEANVAPLSTEYILVEQIQPRGYERYLSYLTTLACLREATFTDPNHPSIESLNTTQIETYKISLPSIDLLFSHDEPNDSIRTMSLIVPLNPQNIANPYTRGEDTKFDEQTNPSIGYFMSTQIDDKEYLFYKEEVVISIPDPRIFNGLLNTYFTPRDTFQIQLPQESNQDLIVRPLESESEVSVDLRTFMDSVRARYDTVAHFGKCTLYYNDIPFLALFPNPIYFLTTICDIANRDA